MDLKTIKKIEILKSLSEEYFLLGKGVPINKHLEFFRLFDIKTSIHTNKHPHKGMTVYVSRKSLKHFVESRKSELLVSHSLDQAISLIFFAIDSIRDTIVDFDLYTYEPPNHIYTKDYTRLNKAYLRIILDCIEKDKRLEIKSIHFSKNRRL